MSGIAEAALKLGLTVPVVRILMEQKVINIGYVVQRKSRKHYIVVPELLEKEVEKNGKRN